MDNTFTKMKFKVAYDLASKVVKIITAEDVEEEHNRLFWVWRPNLDEYFLDLIIKQVNKLYVSNKYSLLHHYISDCYWAAIELAEYKIKKSINDADCIDIPSMFEEIFFVKLKCYDIYIDDFEEKVVKLNEEYLEDSILTKEIFDKEIRNVLEEIVEKMKLVEEDIVNEVFHLLYSNKEFLYCFSQLLSEFISDMDKEDYPNIFTIKGYVRRKKFNKWIERAVFFRDNGTCQSCGKDLTGSYKRIEDSGIHFDHTIPLKLGGSNDPTNVQLLCKKCNLSKNANIIKPEYYYQKFW